MDDLEKVTSQRRVWEEEAENREGRRCGGSMERNAKPKRDPIAVRGSEES